MPTFTSAGAGGFYFSPSEDIQGAMRERLKAYLRCGVTMVKSCGDRTDLMLRLRRQLQQRLFVGPHLVIVGPSFTAPGGHPTELFFWAPNIRPYVRQVEDIDGALKELDDIARKVDGVKAIYGKGFRFTYPRMKPEVLRTLITEAHRRGLKVTVHTDWAEEVKTALKVGADGIEHGSFTEAIEEATWQEMARRRVVFVPTLSVVEGFRRAAQNEPLDEEPFVKETVPSRVIKSLTGKGWGQIWRIGIRFTGDWGWMLKTNMDNVRRAFEAGVFIVCGTDAGNPATFHGPAVHRELQLLVKAGLPPVEALKAATSRCAQWLGIEAGIIAPGKHADLIAVEGNPTKDIMALARLHWVMLDGQIVVNRSPMVPPKETP